MDRYDEKKLTDKPWETVVRIWGLEWVSNRLEINGQWSYT
jgi:hypothetical protein